MFDDVTGAFGMIVAAAALATVAVVAGAALSAPVIALGVVTVATAMAVVGAVSLIKG